MPPFPIRPSPPPDAAATPTEACPRAPEFEPDPVPKPSDGGDLAPEDFYYDGPYLVFTAAYHLKRGFCCNSGCRHCPYAHSA